MTLESFAGTFGRGAVAAEVGDLAFGRALLEVEAALAGALSEAGLAPAEDAAEIEAACRSLAPEPTELGRGTAAAGTPVPALLARLEARLSEPAAASLHRGATSQDVVDSATMLVARRALVPLLADLDAAADAAAGLAAEHGDSLKLGRTLLQQALPSTFGLQAANWTAALDAAAARLEAARDRSLAAQLGGAVGTLAALGEAGPAVRAAFAQRLGLPAAPLPWQSDRTRPADLAAALGIAAGAAGKVGLDVVLLSQTEVGELAPGRGGGSSAMPQKRNPVDAIAAVACARRTPALVATMLGAMLGENERAAGTWQGEAEVLTELLRLTGSGAAAVRATLSELRVDPGRMRANLAVAAGLPMAEALAAALTPDLGRGHARELVAAAAGRARAQAIGLGEAAAANAEIVAAIGTEGIAAALEPERYLGSSSEFIGAALAAHRARRGRRSE